MQITVAAIQFHPIEGDRAENLRRLEPFIAQAVAKGARLILLPETFDFGYDLDIIKRLSESFPNHSTATLSAMARQYNIAIIAGLPERRGKDLFNTALVFDTQGKVVAQYDKTHLCPIPPIDESACFTAGGSLVVTDILGIRLGITICYDIRFPEVYRKLALGGAQLIVHPTAFPLSRIEQFEILLRARAIENQLFILSANQCGKGSTLEFGGHSMMVGPSGEVLARAGDNEEMVILAAIDLDEIEQIRREKPVITKRRPELYL